MPASFEQIAADALALPLEKREQLADLLLGSIDPDDDEPLSDEWATEIERRVQEVANGAKTYPVEEVLAEIRAELRQRQV